VHVKVHTSFPISITVPPLRPPAPPPAAASGPGSAGRWSPQTACVCVCACVYVSGERDLRRVQMIGGAREGGGGSGAPSPTFFFSILTSRLRMRARMSAASFWSSSASAVRASRRGCIRSPVCVRESAGEGACTWGVAGGRVRFLFSLSLSRSTNAPCSWLWTAWLEGRQACRWVLPCV